MPDSELTDGLITSPQEQYDSLRNVSSEVPCPYLRGRSSRNEAFLADRLDAGQYERLMGRGFRRSGRIVYRPRCRACRECRALRVPVQSFAPTRSMRRVWGRNADLRTDIGSPLPDGCKFDLYRRYLDSQHDDAMPRTFEAFYEFLYDSPTETLEFRYMLGERLVGVGIADRCPGGLSSVYMFFDPDFAMRSLGTYSVLWEIAFCRREGLPYYYLGYYVSGSRSMAYKARFRLNEVLTSDERWVLFRE